MNNNLKANPVADEVPVYVQAIAAPVQVESVHYNPPAAGHPAVQSSLDNAGVTMYLTRHGWPVGMQNSFIKNVTKLPMRFFICDNSGSMVAGDGHKLVGEGRHRQSVPCSRWGELSDFIRFHAGLAESGRIVSQFRLLNGSLPIVVGRGDDDGSNLSCLTALLDDSPNGGTPLCRHIAEVTQEIRGMVPFLRATGQRAAVIIATDGESSDGDIAAAMAPLKDLPVWVVIRLCTDEDKIVDYWNNIDKVLELDLDILDDIRGEAEEVCSENDWLTYGEPLHRMREFGVTIKEMDLLDEGKLSPEQICSVIRMILGGNESDYPSPYANWDGFKRAITEACNRESVVWNPITQQVTPWIRVDRLGPHFGKGSGGCVIC